MIFFFTASTTCNYYAFLTFPLNLKVLIRSGNIILQYHNNSVQVLLSMYAQQSAFVSSFGGNFRIAHETRSGVYLDLPLDPSGNRVFILALNTRHPFTILACPRLTDADGNYEATTDSKRRLSCASVD